MTSDREPGLGEETFPGFLHRAGSRIKGVYFGAMGVWTLVQGLPLVAGLVISRLIDRAQGGPADATAWLLLGIAAGLMLARAAVLMGGLRMTFTLIFRASSWIKVQVLGRLMSAPSAQGPVVSVGDVLNRLRDDTDEIGGLLEWTTDLIYRSVLVVVAVGVLIATDALMTLPLILLLGGLWGSVYLKRRVAVLQDETRVQQGDIAGTLADLLTGIRDLRLSGAVTGRGRDLERRFADRRRTQVRQQVYAGLLSDLFGTTVMVGTAAVLLTVSVRIVDGDFSVGKLVLFLTYIAWLGEQMYFFGYILARLESGRVSYERLAALTIDAGPEAVPAVDPLEELVVTGLTCSLQQDGMTPGSVSFTVRPGELVAITGEIGSGKSMLVRSLLALQPEVAGTVRWNDRDVTGEAGHFRVPLVSYAGQSPRFFAGTIRDNLALDARDVTPEQMERALAGVHLSPGSSELPGGLDTVLDSGEARQISGGQRQRLALARMLCHPAQVYVVDDCDSSIDGPTARQIWQTLPAQWPGAWIVVSHNPDLLAAASRVVTVERAVRRTSASPRDEAPGGGPADRGMMEEHHS